MKHERLRCQQGMHSSSPGRPPPRSSQAHPESFSTPGSDGARTTAPTLSGCLAEAGPAWLGDPYRISRYSP